MKLLPKIVEKLENWVVREETDAVEKIVVLPVRDDTYKEDTDNVDTFELLPVMVE